MIMEGDGERCHSAVEGEERATAVQEAGTRSRAQHVTVGVNWGGASIAEDSRAPGKSDVDASDAMHGVHTSSEETRAKGMESDRAEVHSSAEDAKDVGDGAVLRRAELQRGGSVGVDFMEASGSLGNIHSLPLLDESSPMVTRASQSVSDPYRLTSAGSKDSVKSSCSGGVAARRESIFEVDTDDSEEWVVDDGLHVKFTAGDDSPSRPEHDGEGDLQNSSSSDPGGDSSSQVALRVVSLQMEPFGGDSSDALNGGTPQLQLSSGTQVSRLRSSSDSSIKRRSITITPSAESSAEERSAEAGVGMLSPDEPVEQRLRSRTGGRVRAAAMYERPSSVRSGSFRAADFSCKRESGCSALSPRVFGSVLGHTMLMSSALRDMERMCGREWALRHIPRIVLRCNGRLLSAKEKRVVLLKGTGQFWSSKTRDTFVFEWPFAVLPHAATSCAAPVSPRTGSRKQVVSRSAECPDKLLASCDGVGLPFARIKRFGTDIYWTVRNGCNEVQLAALDSSEPGSEKHGPHLFQVLICDEGIALFHVDSQQWVAVSNDRLVIGPVSLQPAARGLTRRKLFRMSQDGKFDVTETFEGVPSQAHLFDVCLRASLQNIVTGKCISAPYRNWMALQSNSLSSMSLEAQLIEVKDDHVTILSQQKRFWSVSKRQEEKASNGTVDGKPVRWLRARKKEVDMTEKFVLEMRGDDVWALRTLFSDKPVKIRRVSKKGRVFGGVCLYVDDVVDPLRLRSGEVAKETCSEDNSQDDARTFLFRFVHIPQVSESKDGDSKLEDSAAIYVKYGPLISLMLEDPTFPFIVSLCMLTLNSKKEKEALTRMLVTVFCSSDMLQQLLSVIISVEVDRCREDISTLFRGDHLNARILSSLNTMFAGQYIRQVLSQPVKHILSSVQDDGWEINPVLAPPGTNVEENVAMIKLAVGLFLNSIFQECERLPTAMRQICHTLASEVNGRPEFESSLNAMLGGYLFLRLLCPAIVSPEMYGIVDDLGPSARRPLVVVSKIIQKLANNFDSFEEEYMMPFNDLLSQYREPLGQFFVDVGALPSFCVTDPCISFHQSEKDFKEAFSVIKKHREEITQKLIEADPLSLRVFNSTIREVDDKEGVINE